jgi:hypothetical protein
MPTTIPTREACICSPDRDEAEPVFVEGKRFALGTTQEKGLSTTFFANPFGPMQRQKETKVLIDKLFDEAV